jgi:hypothetical protein
MLHCVDFKLDLYGAKHYTDHDYLLYVPFDCRVKPHIAVALNILLWHFTKDYGINALCFG